MARGKVHAGGFEVLWIMGFMVLVSSSDLVKFR